MSNEIVHKLQTTDHESGEEPGASKNQWRAPAADVVDLWRTLYDQSPEDQDVALGQPLDAGERPPGRGRRSEPKEQAEDRGPRRPGLLKRLLGKQAGEDGGPDGSGRNGPNIDGPKLENRGSIESLSLPAQFKRTGEDTATNYIEYSATGLKGAKFCYEKRQAEITAADVKAFAAIMAKEPHQLSEDEVFELMACFPIGGRWIGNGNCQQQFRTQEIGGRKVLVVDMKYNDRDLVKQAWIANPQAGADPAAAAFEKNTVEVFWLEGPAKEFAAHKAAVNEAVNKLKWAGKK